MVHHQGKHVDVDDLAKIKAGTHNKNDVLSIVGSPSVDGTFDRKKWVYISKVTETTAFLAPTTAEEEVVAIYFDDNGIVKEVAFHENEDSENIDFVERVTPTSGHSMTFLQQIFGNFGRMSRSDGGVGPAG
jgi:outer membrane protein assembly factor BamE (lipoprotein component of BamABCDE complex)